MSSAIRHLLGIVAACIALILCQFLPFFPGTYDPFALPLSALAQLLGFGAFVFAPLGAVWLFYEVRQRAARQRQSTPVDRGYWFALAAVCAAFLVLSVACLAAFVGGSLTAGLGMLAFSVYALVRFSRWFVRRRQVQVGTFNPVPAYLIAVPLAVLGTRFLFLEAAVEFSRNRGIRNSAELIGEIETYRSKHGAYPSSLAALHKDYEPTIIGVEEFEYFPAGDAYSVYFEHFAVPIGTREIVMFNKLDQHALPSHDSDILQWSPEQLAAQTSHYALHDASSPHWKYFWFD